MSTRTRIPGSIRVIPGHDIEGEVVRKVDDSLYLGEAKEFAIQNDCNVMIKSWKGWEFKKVHIADIDNPDGLIKCGEKGPFKTIYII